MKPVDVANELPRLRDTAGSALSEALGDLVKRGPDASELASLATQLSLQGLPMTPPAAAPSAAGAARGAGWKLALVGATAASGVALWWLFHARAVPRSPETVAAQASAVIAQQMARSSRVAAPLGVERAGAAPLASASVPNVETAATAAPAETSPLPPAATLPHVSSPALRDAVPPSQAVPERAGSEVPALRRSSSPLGAAASKADGQLMDPAAPSEMELLRGARLALKSSPAEALQLAEQHQRLYPSGKLTQERELIAISALVALGRRTAALSRAASFERAFPTSPYRKQIGELLQ